MADIRILYTEDGVGYNHATKADVMNRGFLIAHDASGHHSSVDFPALHIDVNGTALPISSGESAIVFSTSGGLRINRGPFVVSSTGFSPPTTGKYMVNAVCEVNFATTDGWQEAIIKRNTTSILKGYGFFRNTSGYFGLYVNALVLCESTTDVFSFYVNQDSGTATIGGTAAETYFQMWKVGK